MSFGKYRTYDQQWNLTGFADEAQYPGQCPNTLPDQCPVEGCDGRPSRIMLDLGVCSNGHQFRTSIEAALRAGADKNTDYSLEHP